MNVVFIIIGALVVIVIVFIIYRNIKVNKQNKKLNKQRYERIKPLITKLESDESLTPEDVEPFAEQLLTREPTFHLLAEYSKLNLFPEKFNNLVSGAASNLAIWLEFPTGMLVLMKCNT